MSDRLKILFLGVKTGTSNHRLHALSRLGHHVTAIDPNAALPSNRIIGYWKYRTGGLGLAGLVENYVLSRARESTYDVAIVDSGDLLSASAIRELKNFAGAIANFNPDNPYVGSDKGKWRLFFGALPEYDLIVTPRLSSSRAALGAGARRVLTVNFAADEIIHRPIPISDEDYARYASDVAFVGTYLPGRGAFLKRLVERGVPVRIYGGRWSQAPEYKALRPHIILGNLEGEAYVKAVQCTRIAIGLLNKTYEDLHTTRSLEIPAIGTLFCAQRTSDHVAMYEENKEAVFWNSPDECADLCLDLLGHPERIKQIAASGHKRALRNGNFNEPLMSKIIDAALLR